MLIILTTFCRCRLQNVMMLMCLPVFLLFCDVLVCPWCESIDEAEDTLMEFIKDFISPVQTIHSSHVAGKDCIGWNNKCGCSYKKIK